MDVNAKGRIFLGISNCRPIEVDGPFKLSGVVIEYMNEWQISEKKVLFYADGGVPWGKVANC